VELPWPEFSTRLHEMLSLIPGLDIAASSAVPTLLAH
jgi:hypothetical protein